MFAPASPPSAGWSSTDFEWIEVFNNTPAAIDFDATPHVLDDSAGSCDCARRTSTKGTLPAGGVGILFNAVATHGRSNGDDLGCAARTYIPVTSWPQLNNGAEMVAIWDDHDEYDAEAITGRCPSACQRDCGGGVQHGGGHGARLADAHGGAIDLLEQSDGESELGAELDASRHREPIRWDRYNASPLFQQVVDHPGGDIGSPGYAPGGSTLNADFNGDGRVDAADYTGGATTWAASTRERLQHVESELRCGDGERRRSRRCQSRAAERYC